MVRVGTEHVAGFFAVPNLVAVLTRMSFAILRIFVEIGDLAWFRGYLEKTVFEIALNVVPGDTLANDVITAPAQRPQHILHL